MAEVTTEDVLYLPLEKCIERNCGDRVRYSELTDDLNTHWHRSGVQFVSLAAHDAQVLYDAATNLSLPGPTAQGYCVRCEIFSYTAAEEAAREWLYARAMERKDQR